MVDEGEETIPATPRPYPRAIATDHGIAWKPRCPRTRTKLRLLDAGNKNIVSAEKVFELGRGTGNAIAVPAHDSLRDRRWRAALVVMLLLLLLVLLTRPGIWVDAADGEEDEELEGDEDAMRRKGKVPVRFTRRRHTGATPPA